jgi:hypothetical protein
MWARAAWAAFTFLLSIGLIERLPPGAVSEVLKFDSFAQVEKTKTAVTYRLSSSVHKASLKCNQIIPVNEVLRPQYFTVFINPFKTCIVGNREGTESSRRICDSRFACNIRRLHAKLLKFQNVVFGRIVVPFSKSKFFSGQFRYINGGLSPAIYVAYKGLDWLGGLRRDWYGGIDWAEPSPAGFLSVLNQGIRGEPQSHSGEKQAGSKQSYQKGKPIWWISPPGKIALKNLLLIFGFLCSVSGPIFLFGRHARPEIGFPLFLGGLVLMVSVGIV